MGNLNHKKLFPMQYPTSLINIRFKGNWADWHDSAPPPLKNSTHQLI